MKKRLAGMLPLVLLRAWRLRRRPAAARRNEQDLPATDSPDDARERPDGPLGAVRLAGDHRLLHGRPHRLAERGREGAVGVRPLLRAHDVPRDRRLSPGEVQRRPQGAGGRFQRLHQRRLDLLPHDDPRHGPGEGRRDRGRPVPATSSTTSRPSRRRPGPCWASTTRARRRRSQS